MISLRERKMNEFVTPYDVEPSVHSEDEMRTSVDIIFGDKDASTTNLDIIDGERDTTGETVDIGGCKLSGGDEEYVSSAAEILPRYPVVAVAPICFQIAATVMVLYTGALEKRVPYCRP